MITSLPHILLLTKDSLLVDRISRELSHWHVIDSCEELNEVADHFRERTPQCMLIDVRANAGGGHAEACFLEELHHHFPELPILLLSEEELPEPVQRLVACAPALRWSQQADPEVLAEQLRDASQAKPNTAERKTDSQSDRGRGDLCDQFETRTAAMRQMLDDLQVAAEHDVTVMLIGETGSGKTHLSKMIHGVSPRHDEPFVTVACGALPNDLIESELFGHVKGAFTSAHANKEGKFLAAGRGTILLDEIDVLGLEQQVKLLRVIESGEFEPVGSNQTHHSQARIIVASNLDLQPLVERGLFRPDLYYRLNMLKFDLLPLRTRRADIVPLAERFVELFSAKHQVPIDAVDDSVFETLLAYPWPGNVRELEHVIQRAVIYCRDGRLEPRHLPSHITAGIAGPSNQTTAIHVSATPTVKIAKPAPEAEPLHRQVALTEQEIIEHALLRNSHSRTQTAKDLGISRVTLYNKMKKYGISM